MTYHAMFSLYIMTGLLALVISVSLFCKSVAEAKEWKRFIRTQDQSSALRRTNVLKVKQGQQKRLAYRERLFMRH